MKNFIEIRDLDGTLVMVNLKKIEDIQPLEICDCLFNFLKKKYKSRIYYMDSERDFLLPYEELKKQLGYKK